MKPFARALVFAALALSFALVSGSRGPIVRAAGVLTPSGPWAEGTVAAVWLAGGGSASPAAEVAAEAGRASGLSVQAIWMLQGGLWRYWLPIAPSAGTLQDVPAVASIMVVLERGSSPSTVVLNPAAGLEKAKTVLIDQVIRPEILGPGEQVVAFTLDAPLAPGSRVAAYLPDPLPNAGAPAVCTASEIVLDRPTWFFWVDDYPSAYFAHPSRFVFIDDAGLAVRGVEQQAWPPCINGEPVSRWSGEAALDAGNVAYSNLPPEGLALTASALPDALLRASAASDWAIVPIIGSEPIPNPNVDREGNPVNPKPAEQAIEKWRTQLAMAESVRQAAVFAEKAGIAWRPSIPPGGTLNPPGPGVEWIRAGIQRATEGNSNPVLLYIVGHGAKTESGETAVMVRGKPVTSADLAKLLSEYPNTKFNIAIDACLSGALAKDLVGVDAQGRAKVPNLEGFHASVGPDGLALNSVRLGGIWSNVFWQGITNSLNDPLLSNCLRCLTDDAALKADQRAPTLAWRQRGTVLPFGQPPAQPTTQPTASPTTLPTATATVTPTVTATTTPTSTPTATTTPAAGSIFNGPFQGSGEFDEDGCTWRKSITGTIQMQVTFEPDRVVGTATLNYSFTATYLRGPGDCAGPEEQYTRSERPAVSGTASRITFAFDPPYTHATFTGSLIGNAIVGDIAVVSASSGLTGSFTIPGVTLSRNQ